MARMLIWLFAVHQGPLGIDNNICDDKIENTWNDNWTSKLHYADRAKHKHKLKQKHHIDGIAVGKHNRQSSLYVDSVQLQSLTQVKKKLLRQKPPKPLCVFAWNTVKFHTLPDLARTLSALQRRRPHLLTVFIFIRLHIRFSRFISSRQTRADSAKLKYKSRWSKNHSALHRAGHGKCLGVKMDKDMAARFQVCFTGLRNLLDAHIESIWYAMAFAQNSKITDQ